MVASELNELRTVATTATYDNNRHVQIEGNANNVAMRLVATAATYAVPVVFSTAVDIRSANSAWMNGKSGNWTSDDPPSELTECYCSDLQHDDYSPLYAWFNYILIIIMLPSLSIFGVVTNIVNVFIFSRKKMRSSANTYLGFLACSDFMVIITGLFIFWIDSARSYITILEQAPYTAIYGLPLGYMAQTCSIYFTVAAAFDCYISVCWRRAARAYCVSQRARQINGFIVLCAVLYNTPRFWQFRLQKCFHDGSQELVLEICPNEDLFDNNTVTIYNVYLYMILMTLLPFCLLLLLNLLIIVRQSLERRRINQQINAERRRLKMAPIARDTETDSPLLQTANLSVRNKNTADKNSLTVADNHGKMGSPKEPNRNLSITIVDPSRLHTTQIRSASCISTDSKNNATDDTITMIMALIVNVIETFFEPDALLLNLLSDTSNFLVVFNSSVNCVIYMIFNTEYREHCLMYLFKVKQRLSCILSPRKASNNAQHPLRMSQQKHHNKQRKHNGDAGTRVAPNAERFVYRSAGNEDESSGTRNVDSNDDRDMLLCGHRCTSPIWHHTRTTSTPLSHHWLQTTSINPVLERQGALQAQNADVLEAQDVFDAEASLPCDCDVFEMRKSETRLSFQPSNCETLLLVDDDSGLDESASTTTTTLLLNGFYDRYRMPSAILPSYAHTTSYLAEVKVLHENNANEAPTRPHIYVRPLLHNNISNNNNNRTVSNSTTPTRATPSGDNINSGGGGNSAGVSRQSSERLSALSSKLSITAL